MKKSIKILSLIMAVLILMCFVSCGQKNRTAKQLPDYDLKKDELKVEIAGWVIPQVMDDVQFEYIKESGMNSVFLVNAGTYEFDTSNPTEDNLRVIEKLKENGIRTYIHNKGDESSIVDIKNFKDNPAVCGLVYDEPDKNEIDKLSLYVDNYNASGNSKLLYVNLFPSFAESLKADFQYYEDYLKYYVEKILLKTTSEEKILSADRYPLTFNSKGQKTLDSGWLSDVYSVAKVAKEYETRENIKIRTNFFIQTMPFTRGQQPTEGQNMSRDRVPTYEDIRMQEYALMAFGYDSISLFCYGTPKISNEFAEDDVALIDRNGNKTEIFSACAKANKEILDFDHVIMQFDWKGNFASDKNVFTDDLPRKTNIDVERISIKDVSGLQSVESTEDTLYGYFLDNDDNTGLMIVNYNETSLQLKNSVTLNFDDSYNYNKVRVYVNGKPEVMNIKNNSVTINLGVGEGVFAIPYSE